MNHPRLFALLPLLALTACDDEPPAPLTVADGIYATPGEIRPSATDEQRATFTRGEAVATRRFTPETGLGPLFNVSFCAACHEKPVFGGAAGRYRDFFLHGATLDGGFVEGGSRGGILAAYGIGDAPIRPSPAEGSDTFALRNPIPFFGVGLLAEISEDAILANADPDDADGDGISGRPNYDRGFVGRFGTKAQTVSIEGFIRGPFNNHLGVTSDPLTEEMRARLPVPSNNTDGEGAPLRTVSGGLGEARFHQAAAPSEPLFDDDAAPDPELSREDLFDLVSWAMLLAAPRPAEPTEATRRGEATFAEIGCAACHIPLLPAARGGIPAYTDLLLHDMGPELADGVTFGVALGSEFRTAPLWGVAAIGPYLHDGRADTLDEAIRHHGGEGARARDAYAALDETARAELIGFLESLGGAEIRTPGLIPPDAPLPPVGAPGGPARPLTPDEARLWLAGRAVFDRDTAIAAGLGPVFNGDSCRACHFDPVPGGAGPSDVNAMRYGYLDDAGAFRYPEDGATGLFKLAIAGHVRPDHPDAAVFEPRQTPTLLGLGALDAISPEAILERADPTDLDGDGISGVAHILADGRLGRFGWKAQLPDVREFVADALANELHLTLDPALDLGFARLTDDDDAPDPELSDADFDALAFFVGQLAPPAPRAAAGEGRVVFERIGCDRCHVPRLTGLPTAAPDAYTDLLLHAIGPPDRLGIADGDATPAEFRTPPLWGLWSTAPYLHDGSATTVAAAIEAHGGEAEAVRMDYEALGPSEKAALLAFLEGL